MRVVARALHDTVVELDEDMHLYSPAADLHPLFGETVPEAQFQDLLSADDQRRFRQAVHLASVSQQPRILHDVMLSQSKCELMVAECGNGAGYLIGIRIKRAFSEGMCTRQSSIGSRLSGNSANGQEVFCKTDSDRSWHSVGSSCHPQGIEFPDPLEFAAGYGLDMPVGSPRSLCCASPNTVASFRPFDDNVVTKTLSSNSLSKMMGRSSSAVRKVRSNRSNRSHASSSLIGDILHCWDADDDAEDSKFVQTPFSSCYKSIVMTLKHWNLPKGNIRCCQWHSVVDMLNLVIDKIGKTDCDTEWQQFMSWQCGRCKCVNSCTRECDVCGAECQSLAP